MDFLTFSDTLRNGQKCRYMWSVTETSHFKCNVDSIEARKVSMQIYHVTVTGVTVRSEACILQIRFPSNLLLYQWTALCRNERSPGARWSMGGGGRGVYGCSVGKPQLRARDLWPVERRRRRRRRWQWQRSSSYVDLERGEHKKWRVQGGPSDRIVGMG